MLTMTVRAKDLAGFLELPRSALGYGMFYNKPYNVGSQVVGAEGTLFTVIANSVVACTMATRNRVIIHASIPCANVENNSGDLYALEAPKDLDRVLRRFGDKMVALTFDDGRFEIDLPRPQNMRGKIWLPMARVNGHMLSAACREPATTLCLNADLFIAALRRVPRGERWHLLAIQPTDEGLDLRYPVNGAAASERLHATTLERGDSTSPFVSSARYVAGLVRVLKTLQKHGPQIRVQVSTSRLAAWNDSVTIQFFADKNPGDWKGPSVPDTNSDIPEIQLLLDRRMSDLRKDTGKWLRRLVRNAKANRKRVETTWVLSHDRVVVDIDGGIQTSVEIPCACDRWPLEDNEISLSVCPLITAALLECCEKGTDGCCLVYQNSLLTFRSSSPSYELIAHGILSKSLESACLRRTDVHTTRTAI